MRMSRFKFHTQLMIYFLLTIVLITACLLASLTMSLKKSYRDKENDMLVNQARQAVMNIENRISYYQSFMELFLNDRELIGMLENDSMSDIDAYLTEKTSDFLQMNAGGIRDMRIHKEGYYNQDYTQRQLPGIFNALKAVSGTTPVNEYWTGTYLNENNEKVFSVFKRIYQTNPERSYFAELCLYETEVYGFFNEDTSGNHIFIVKDGQLMSMSGRDAFNDRLYDARHSSLSETVMLEYPDEIRISASGNNGWEAVISTDAGYLDRGFYKALSDILPVITGALVLALLLVISISRNLNRRMDIVRRKIMDIKNGDLTTMVAIDGRDEFKILADEIENTRLHIQSLLNEIHETNQNQRTAEMTALRAQMNSHFLFNALASLKWLSYDAGQRAVLATAIDRLAVFLRYSISLKENYVPLAKETEQLEAYVYLQKLRCGDELNVVVDIDEELKDCPTVKLILQPLVENAVMHGRKSDGDVLNILIYSYYDAEDYFLVIEDDGAGMSGEKIQEVFDERHQQEYHGYGLKNIIRRLEICSAGMSSLTIESEKDIYTKIVIRQKRKRD